MSERGACPCGGAPQGAPYERCCEPYHLGARPAPTPERLMRARYCAYVKRLASYLVETWAGPERPRLDELERELKEGQARWVNLTIINAQGDESALVGSVSFEAQLLEGAHLTTLREQSRFERLPKEGAQERSQGHQEATTPLSSHPWRYVSGQARWSQRSVSRNEPCPCGREQKFKRCCFRASS